MSTCTLFLGDYMQVKTLAMLKMEKNFVAVLEKKYPRKPYEHYTLQFLIERLEQEVAELKKACNAWNTENAKGECADVSNIIDYIFECLSHGDLDEAAVFEGLGALFR